jgi:hypothetical protein
VAARATGVASSGYGHDLPHLFRAHDRPAGPELRALTDEQLDELTVISDSAVRVARGSVRVSSRRARVDTECHGSGRPAVAESLERAVTACACQADPRPHYLRPRSDFVVLQLSAFPAQPARGLRDGQNRQLRAGSTNGEKNGSTMRKARQDRYPG